MVSTWAAQAFKCYYGTSNGDIETVSRSSNTTNSDYSMFYFMPDTDKDNDQSGMADIESNGDITLKQSLSGHYISVKVYLKVSGCQRGTDTFKNGVGNDNYPTNSYGLKYLLTLKLTATKTLKN